jgi:hypothetical protein
LKFAPFKLTEETIQTCDNVQVMTLSYQDDPMESTVYTVGNIVLHSLRLCFYFYHRLKVTYLTHQESHFPHPDLKESLSELLAQTGHLRRVQLGIDDKQEFLDYYYYGRCQRGYKTD